MNHPDVLIPLRDAIGISDPKLKVTLLGVIVEYGLPRKSRGTDFVCVVKIVDDSHQQPEISVNIFSESLDDLPHVKSAGDIIYVSRVTMKAYNGEVTAVFNKKFSTFALFEGKTSNVVNPYQASSRFCLRNLDDKFITQLRIWFPNFQPFGGTSEYLLSLKEIEVGKYFDLVCKILLVSEVSKDKWMLFVWDGTDTPPLSVETKLEDEATSSLPLHWEPLPLPRETLCTFPSVGTILRVVGGPGDEKLGLHFQGNSQWVRLRNLCCQACSGLWRGILIPTTKLRLLSNEDSLVTQRQRNYDERISTKCGCLPLLSFPCSYITETDYEHAPYVTLMDLLTYSEVTAKFKCVVRVVAAYPWKADDFRSPIGMRVYRIRFTLEDPTARIHAFVYAEDGAKFFEGYPPVDVLTSKRNKLLGITDDENSKDNENTPRNPPWIQCCIKSYYLDKNDGWGSRRYRIFGTRLVA